MKIVSITQNGREWHEWRGKGLGASEAPIIMGDSPWTTPFQLWLAKTGLCPQEPPNEYSLAAMRRGHELEPRIREMAEYELGRLYPSLSAGHEDLSYIRASFDGVNIPHRSFIEIKAPNKVDHAKAVAGKVPTKYFAQVQQQFLVSGFEIGFYVSWSGVEGDAIAIVPIAPDTAYIETLKEQLGLFWGLVQMNLPPAISSKEKGKLFARAVKLQEQLGSVLKALEIAHDTD